VLVAVTSHACNPEGITQRTRPMCCMNTANSYMNCAHSLHLQCSVFSERPHYHRSRHTHCFEEEIPLSHPASVLAQTTSRRVYDPAHLLSESRSHLLDSLCSIYLVARSGPSLSVHHPSISPPYICPFPSPHHLRLLCLNRRLHQLALFPLNLIPGDHPRPQRGESSLRV
jgi:hypothetical protein